MKNLRIALLVACATSLSVSCERALAQGDGYLSSNNLRGVVTGNTYQFADIDNINLGTGAINIRIPLVSVKGRGISNEYVYSYSSKIWVAMPEWDYTNPKVLDSLAWAPTGQVNGMIVENPGGQATWFEQEYDCEINSLPLAESVDSGFSYITNDGTTYQFGNRHVWNSDGSSPYSKSCPGVNITQYNVMQSSEGVMQLDSTNITGTHYFPIVTMKNGWRSTLGSLEDTNGNLENGNGDTLLRPLTLTPQMTISVKDSNGTSQSYALQGAAVSVSTLFPSTTCGSAPVQQYSTAGPIGEVNSLTLPNGWQYTFTYDPHFGDITKVILPSGGYIRYDYTIIPQVDGGPANTHCLLDSRRIAHRYVSPDGNPQHEQMWTYTWSVVGSTSTDTVTDPLGNVVVHSFLTLDNPNIGGGVPYETTTQYQKSGTVMKTISNTWTSDGCAIQSVQGNGKAGSVLVTGAVNPRITDTKTTLNDSNQVSDHQTDYDSFTPPTGYCTSLTESRMNPTEVREYDYGSNGVAGSLLRKTDYTYLHNNNSNYLNAHIWDRPASKVIYDGSSNLKAQATYEYDNFTAGLSASGAVQHDSTYSTTYTLRGDLTATSRWRNTDGAWLTTRNQYDDAGNVLSSTDPKSYTTSYSFADSWGNTTCVPTGGNGAAYSTTTTDPLTHKFKGTYNSCSGTLASATDVNNRTTTITYDSMGRPTQVKAPDNSQTSSSYVDTAPLSASSTATVTSSLNSVNTVLLDGLARISETQLNSDPSGTIYADTTYDALSRESTVSNAYRTSNDPGPTNGITTSSYDALGRVTQLTPPDGNLNTGANTVKTSYYGNCTTVTDQAGKIRKSCADGLGRLTQVFEPDVNNNLVNETDYTYDALDNLLTVNQKGNDPNSGDWRTRTFVYNSLSQLTSATNPETGPIGAAGAITYTYDNNGNLATKTFPQQNQTNSSSTITGYFCYDSENRLISKRYSTTALTCPLSSPLATYTYDGTNCLTLSTCYNIHHRTSMTDPAGSEIWAYGDITNQGPMTVDQRTTNSVTKTATYQYNLDGSLAALTYPSGRVITYALAFSGTNTASRSASAVDSSGPINYATGALYAPQGALSYVQNGAGFYSTYLFNDRLQPCWIYSNTSSSGAPATCTQTGVANAALMDFQYSFSLGTADNGDVSRVTNRINSARSVTYLYDELNRIHDAVTDATSGQFCWGQLFGTQSGSTFTSGYDPWGNFKTITADPNRPACPVNTMARTLNAYNKIVDTNFGYDADGNLTADPSLTYTYDNENHLTATANMTYLYDGDGKRVEKASGGSATKLYWFGAGSDALDETDAAGNTSNSSFNEYVFFNGKRIARRDYQNNVFYYFSDHLGTSREIVEAGQMSPCYDADFYPFGGEAVVATNACSQNYKFTAKERDSESGLDNFGARYNSSSMGRFMSPDNPKFSEKTDPQTWNLYSYVSNNPLARVDLTGDNWFNIGGSWQWYDGANVTNDGKACKQGTKGCNHSDYTHLLVVQKLNEKTDKGATKVNITLYDQNKVIAQGTGFTGGNGDNPVPNGNYQINLNNRGGVDTDVSVAMGGGYYVLRAFHDGIQEVGSAIPAGDGTINWQDEWGSLRANLSRGPGDGTQYYLHGKGLYFTEGHSYTAGCVCDPYQGVLKVIFRLDPSGVGEGDKNGRIAVSVSKPN